MASYEKVEKFCKSIGGKLSDRKSIISKKVVGNYCFLGKEQDATTISGDKETDRIDVEQRGFDFTFHLKDIDCDHSRKQCDILGERGGVRATVSVKKDKGIHYAETRTTIGATDTPIMTIFNEKN